MSNKTTIQTFGLFLALSAIVASAPLLWSYRMQRQDGHDPTVGLAVGERLPDVTQVEGWLNGDINAGDLDGKVVVVDYWFLTCPYCHRKMPELVELHSRYADRDDIVFIGLTDDSPTSPVAPQSVANLEQFLTKFKVTWPNAYGAVPVLKAMRASAAPTYWVVGRDGSVVWNLSSRDSIESAIDRALAVPDRRPKPDEPTALQKAADAGPERDGTSVEPNESSSVSKVAEGV